MRITKAKVTGNGHLEASYVDDDENSIDYKGKNPVHPDLRAALDKLVPYFADLTEQAHVDFGHVDDAATNTALQEFCVCSVSVKGAEESEGCTLSGKRTLLTSKVLNLNSPFTGFSSENEEYAYCDDLRDAVQAFFYEVEQYIVNKKWAFVQKEIDFTNADDPFAGEAESTDSVGGDDKAA